MADYGEFFEGLQQLISGFEEFINQGLLPQSQGLGQFLGLIGGVVFIGISIFLLMRFVASGKIGRNV